MKRAVGASDAVTLERHRRSKRPRLAPAGAENTGASVPAIVGPAELQLAADGPTELRREELGAAGLILRDYARICGLHAH